MKYDCNDTDVYILEAGSDIDKLSKYYTWHANTDQINKEGLRYSRGMNFGLLELFKQKNGINMKLFLLTNDTELSSTKTLAQ